MSLKESGFKCEVIDNPQFYITVNARSMVNKASTIHHLILDEAMGLAYLAKSQPTHYTRDL